MVKTEHSAKSLEPLILAFEKAWVADSPPSIKRFLKDCDTKHRTYLARELALIDMEFRWQASYEGRHIVGEFGDRPTWHLYTEHIPELGDLSRIPPELVAEEYRIRQLWGERPGHDGFISAFPHQFPLLPPLLAEIDAELLADDAVPQQRVDSVRRDAAVDPRAPLPWSDYLLQEHVGSGGFGKVYRAVQRSLDRLVAVKALHKSRQRDSQAIEHFLQEARLLARLNHRGIVGVHGLGRYPGGGYFLVLDWVDGQDLQQRIQAEPLAIDQAVRITSLVAEAIQHVHERGVIHGDLKPSNIMVDELQRIHVTDFGLACLSQTIGDTVSPTHFGGGTLSYIAPEVMLGGEWGRGVDVYGLGAILYAMLTGQPPRQARDPESLRAQLEAGDGLTRPSILRSGIPAHLDEIVMKCLDSSPTARFASATEVIRLLAD